MEDIWKTIFSDFDVKTLLILCQVNHEFFNYVHELKIKQYYKFLIMGGHRPFLGNLLSCLTFIFNRFKHDIYQVSDVQILIGDKITSYKFDSNHFDIQYKYNHCNHFDIRSVYNHCDVIDINTIYRFIMIDGSFFDIEDEWL